MDFSLPHDGLIYTEFVLARSRDLISQRIWHGIDDARLAGWLNNFRDDRQRYFAARVLDTLMYRSDDQTKAMVTQLFQRTLPDLARASALPSTLTAPLDALRSANDPLVRLAPVMPESRGTMASGPLIARIARRHLGLNRRWILSPEDAANTGLFIVFIDDFLGTGTQFENFITHRALAHLVEARRCCYVTLAVHATGLRHLRRKFPHLPVAGVELLTRGHSIFSQHTTAPHAANTIQATTAFYDALLDQFQILDDDFRHGYGRLQLAYAFSHAVPNNSTPLLWWPAAGPWLPLFER